MKHHGNPEQFFDDGFIRRDVRHMLADMTFEMMLEHRRDIEFISGHLWDRELKVGQTISIRMPERYVMARTEG